MQRDQNPREHAPCHTKCLAHGVICIAQLECNAAAASARIDPRGPIYCLSKFIQKRLASPIPWGCQGRQIDLLHPCIWPLWAYMLQGTGRLSLLHLSAAALASLANTGRRRALIICLMALSHLSVLVLALAGSSLRTSVPSSAAGVKRSCHLDMHRPQARLEHLLGGLSRRSVLGLGVRQQHAVDDCIIVPRKYCQPNLDDSPVVHHKSCVQKS